jgi:transcriptional regulator with XRE-family HTH domain
MKNKLREEREAKDWSQERLAEESEVSRTTISAIETGKEVAVTIATLDKLSTALGKKVTDIFFQD